MCSWVNVYRICDGSMAEGDVEAPFSGLQAIGLTVRPPLLTRADEVID